MNPLLSAALLNSNNAFENNGLSDLSQVGDGLVTGTDFQQQFAELWQQMTATGGKDQPFQLAAVQELRPELIEQLADQFNISQEALLSLPPASVQAWMQLLQQPQALAGQSMFPSQGMNPVASRLQADVARLELEKNGNNGIKLEGQLDEQVQARLLKSALEENRQPPSALSNLKDMADSDVLQQLSMLKMLNNELDEKALLGSQLTETNSGRLFESLASIDRPASNSFTPISGNQILTPNRSEQAPIQLPRIEVPMNQPQWGQAVGERLMFMVNTKVQAASMILNPPELGPIEVRVNINQDQASVQFVSSHAAVRDAIEEAFPKLRDMFAQNGLSLADANVSQHSEQQQRYDQAASDAGIQNEAGVVETEEAASADVITRINGIGLVDQYV